MDAKYRSTRWLLTAVALLAGCAGQTPSAPSAPSATLVVRSSTSFGMCPAESLCETSLEISGGAVTFIARSRTGRQERQSGMLSVGEWANLERRAREARFDGLAPVIGCPDCADGGAESVSVVSSGSSRNVTFEFGADVPPVAPLVESLREIRRRFWRY